MKPKKNVQMLKWRTIDTAMAEKFSSSGRGGSAIIYK